MMAGARHMLHHRQLPRAASQQPNAPPSFVFFEAIQVVAGYHARLATRTCIEINFECILFSGPRSGQRNQVAIVFGLRRRRITFMLPGELLDSRQLLLVLKKLLQQCQSRTSGCGRLQDKGGH